VQGHGDHAAEHDELALGEVDDPGGIVDDIEPDADNGVNGSIGQAGNEVLEK
jgi:hypothetical protein